MRDADREHMNSGRGNTEGRAKDVHTILLKPLALIGRQGTKALAASIFIGLALPQFASLARPLIGTCVFFFLVFTFLRADFGAIRALLRQPGRILLAWFWIVASLPIALGGIVLALGHDLVGPELALGLALMAAAPPILSAPAVATLLGFDASFLVTVLVASMVTTPLTAPLVADVIAGAAVPIDTSVLALRLALLLGGAAVLAQVLRWLLGLARIARERAALDGLNVVFFFIFAVGAMDGVADAMVANPVTVVTDALIVFVVAFAGIAAGLLVLAARFGAREAFVIGYATGHRNMGLLVAAMAGAVPDGTWLYFAMAQFPIYLMPLVLEPLARRMLRTPLPARR